MKAHAELSMRQALQAIVQQTHGQCGTFTTGIGSCFRNGRLVYARYGADQACPSCIATAGLQHEDVAA